jgi:hypothetical protein
MGKFGKENRTEHQRISRKLLWFVKQYDEEIKKVLEPKDEYNVFVNSTIKRLNALQ